MQPPRDWASHESLSYPPGPEIKGNALPWEEKWAIDGEGRKGEREETPEWETEVRSIHRSRMTEAERVEGRTSAVSFTPLSAGRGPRCALGLRGSPHHSTVKVGRVLEEVECSERAVLLWYPRGALPSGSDSLPTAGGFSGLAILPSNQTDRAAAFEDQTSPQSKETDASSSVRPPLVSPLPALISMHLVSTRLPLPPAPELLEGRNRISLTVVSAAPLTPAPPCLGRGRRGVNVCYIN